MMWAEIAFSSFLVLTAIFLSSQSAAPQPFIYDWAAYAHLEDGAVLIGENLRAGGANPIPTLNSLTISTPYCISFDPDGDFTPAVSCSGKEVPAYSPILSNSSTAPASASISLRSFVWRGNRAVFFTLRQWTNLK